MPKEAHAEISHAATPSPLNVATGAPSEADEDEIYIECNPTGESGKKLELRKVPNVTKISKEMKEVLDFILKFLIAFIVIKFAWSLPRLISKNSKKNQPPVQQPAK